MDLTLDYKLLKSLSKETNEITLISKKNAKQLIDIIVNSSFTYLDGTLIFWVELINVPENLGFYINWALIYIQASGPNCLSMVIGFPGHEIVLGRWRFEYSENQPLPFPSEILITKKDIGSLVDRIQEILREIEKDSDEYNKYIENNLPILYRTGYITIKDYYEICPEEDIKLSEEQKTEILNSPPHYIYVDLTLRKYLEIFTKLHSTMMGLDPEKYGGDKEYYENITGISLAPLYVDLDSPQVFRQFAKGGCLQRGIFDLIYTKICLVPEDLCPFDNYPIKNLWRIHLNILDNSFIDLALKGYLAVKKEVILIREREIFNIIQHKGLIRLSSTPLHEIHNTSLRFGDQGVGRDEDKVYLDKLYPFDSLERLEKVKEKIQKFEPINNGLLHKQKTYERKILRTSQEISTTGN
jgi:hypothetical protein